MRTVFLGSLMAVVATLLIASNPADAWWCSGHMTVAHIAKSTMSATAVQRVNTIIADLSAAGPFPQSPDMVQVACWADDLKAQSLTVMNNWHFVDQIYNPSNYPIDPKMEVLPDETVDHIITQLDKGVVANMASADKKQWILQLAVAFLIHFYGDIHQPLHAVQLFSKQYPRGDYGGNAESIIIDGETQNLHKFWDSICWTHNNDPARPLSPTALADLDSYAQNLMKTYTFPSSMTTVSNSTTMARESYNDAINYVYPGISSGMVMTQAYTDRCIPVAEGRITLAGLRLGNTLEEMFGEGVKDFDYKSKDDGSISDASAVLVKRIHRRLAEIIVARQTSANHVGKQFTDKVAGNKVATGLGSRFKSILASLRG